MKHLLITLILPLICVLSSAQSRYDKVKSEPLDWTGEYLIVKEIDSLSTGVVFDGSLTDLLNKKHNCFRVKIDENDAISSTAETDAATFYITKQTDGTYTIRSKSGYYIGALQSDSANMTTKKSMPLFHTICFESDTTTKVKIQAACGYVLRYNNDVESDRFRFYAEGKKKGIHLYKKVTTTSVEQVLSDEYNLIDGRLYSLPAGMYILNGRLVFRRD